MNSKSGVRALGISLIFLCLSLIACNSSGDSFTHWGQTNPSPTTPENRPPVLNPIGSKTVDEGAMLQFTVTGSDPDGNNLAYSASNLPAGASFDPATQVFTWTPDYGQAGNYPNVLFTVTDNGTPPQSGYESITITVGDVNRPPVLNPIGSKTVDEGAMLQFTVTGSDPDGNNLAYSASNLPAGASFDPATQMFTWTPDYGQAGNYPDVHFEVSDGALVDIEDIVITVNLSPVLQVNIDIVPGDASNEIDLRQPNISVAILSAANFSAPSEVDRATLTFGATGDENSFRNCAPGAADVNWDGLGDLTCTFRTRNTGFQCGDTTGILKGRTVTGIPFEGSQAIVITPCN
jgi:hypothetical protein